MGKLLEDFYFGRIAPWGMRVIPDLDLQRAMDDMLRHEEQLPDNSTKWSGRFLTS